MRTIRKPFYFLYYLGGRVALIPLYGMGPGIRFNSFKEFCRIIDEEKGGKEKTPPLSNDPDEYAPGEDWYA
jgi:hypothetical protein